MLVAPNISAKESFLTSISRVRVAALKASLTSVEPIVVSSSTDFQTAVSNLNVHNILTHLSVGVVSKKEMTKVYTDRMAKEKAPGRSIYDEIFSSSALCPYCEHGAVETLDHYLPKALFPSLAVTPLNLIPACYDCNIGKLHWLARQAGEQLLHPYFDDAETERWLEANVIEQFPAAVSFEVRAPAAWDPIKVSRFKSHLKALKLKKLYNPQASNQISCMRDFLGKSFINNGADGVRQQLSDMIVSYEKISKNSWQSATYRALAANNWYCEGGDFR